MTTAQKKKTTTSRTTKKSTSIPELPKNPLAFEVLHLASKQRSKAKKVEVLKKYQHESLKTIFVWNFDTNIISVLPEGEVPYTGYDEQNTYSGTLSTKIDEQVRSMHETGSFSLGASDRQGHTTIRREFKNFYNFVKGGNDAMNSIRRETMFINILEGLHPLEAEIVCLCKDKKLSEKYKITKEIVSEAYPEIHWRDNS
jgi:hypothetical protein